jgi:hypothetical protein
MADNTGPYVTLQQIRDLGLTQAQYPDAQVNAEIKLWSDSFDQWTGQWFNSRAKTIRLEGKNSNVLFLGIPILTVTQIKMNNETVPTALSFFEIFNNRGSKPDDRRNPMIKMLSKSDIIFSQSNSRVFRRGFFTDITGTFGFLEADGTTPQMVQRAIMKLVVRGLKQPINSTATAGNLGPKKREKTDLHETEYFEPETGSAASGAVSLSGDPEVDKIIGIYKAPMAIGGSILDVPALETTYNDDYEF